MGLCDVDPTFSLYNEQWPLFTAPDHTGAPAKFVFANVAEKRVGTATDSGHLPKDASSPAGG